MLKNNFLTCKIRYRNAFVLFRQQLAFSIKNPSLLRIVEIPRGMPKKDDIFLRKFSENSRWVIAKSTGNFGKFWVKLKNISYPQYGGYKFL